MKNTSTKAFILFLTAMVVLLAFNFFKKPFAKNFVQTETDNLVPTPTPLPDQSLLLWETMDAKQKILQLIALPVVLDKNNDNTSELASWLAKHPVGIITLFGNKLDASLAQQAISQLRATYQANIPQPLIAVDHEGGSVQRLSGVGFSVLPAWKDICEGNLSQQEIDQLYEKSAQELFETGVNIVFAPVVDLQRPSGVLANRACSDDQDKVVAMSSRFIYAFAKHNIMSTIKHFPGIGGASKDLHFASAKTALQPAEADVFLNILNQYPNIGVMTAHVGLLEVPFTSPCSLTPVCLSALRADFPEAVIFSDALEMQSALNYATELNNLIKKEKQQLSTETLPKLDKVSDLALIAKQAVVAGNDVLVFGPAVTVLEMQTVVDYLVEEYDLDSDFAKRVNDSSLKIMQLKKVDNILQAE